MKVKLNSSKRVCKRYSKDWSIYEKIPQFVAFPKTEQDVVSLVEYARDKNISITARGGGTGLSGAAIGTGIVVDFSRHMKQIYKVGKTTKAQSGALLSTLRPRIEKAGYMLPSVPLHNWCAIGGNVNTRSVGPRTATYGTMDNQVKSLRGVLADGRIIDTSRKNGIPTDIQEAVLALRKQLRKDTIVTAYLKSRPLVAGGYNLLALLQHKDVKDIVTHLLVGSVGTLALLTEVTLTLPKFKKLESIYLIHLRDLDSAQKTLNKLLKLKPVSIQYADKQTLALWDKQYHYEGSEVAFIAVFEEQTDVTKAVVDALHCREIPEKKQKHLWKSRAAALPKLERHAKRIGLHVPPGIDDTTIHPRDFAAIMKKVKEYEALHNIPIASFGHLAMGSIHLRAFIDMKRHPEKLDTLGKELFKIVHKYNGTLVGEHNAGPCRSRYLEMEHTRMYEYMKKVKAIFDPEQRLNPHVMFDLDPITKNLGV